MNEIHKECLQKAFEKLLLKPHSGSMAYVRCLSLDVINDLVDEHPIDVSGWEVYAVLNSMSDNSRFLTADFAVDLREKKRNNILLIVDRREAGPGMDGIYSAARELGETELFDVANDIALKKLNRDERGFVQSALRKARKIGKCNAISPWKEFDFYARCAYEPDKIGQHITFIGLWPIDTSECIRENDLDLSMPLVEMLIHPSSASNTVYNRVDSLVLPNDAEPQKEGLLKFLQEAEKKHWADAISELSDISDLWLNILKPGCFEQKLQSINIVPWRKTKGRPFKWTGLNFQEENNELILYLKQVEDISANLQVRWKTLPSQLPPGSVSYHISIITGFESELVSKTVSHSGKSYEKCVFTGEDFEELATLDPNGKWEAVVRVRPLQIDNSQTDDVNQLNEVESESFILTFSEDFSETKESTVGKKIRALVEVAIELPTTEDFIEACKIACIEDKKSYISFRLKGKSGRVFFPSLIKEIETKWEEKGYEIGRWIVRVRDDGTAAGPVSFLPINVESSDTDINKKIDDVTRSLARKAMNRCSFIGFIYHGNENANNYVNVWISAFDKNPNLALANTLEVKTQGNETIGLIVLPFHPVRVAWHQAYDELVYYARYKENLKTSEILESVKPLDGSYYPFFLPGFEKGETFIFGDLLGFYAVAMIRANEVEPQAKIALMARCLSSSREDIAPLSGESTSEVISREITKYSNLHSSYKFLRINAIRPGDGQTIARALGHALIKSNNGDEEGMNQSDDGHERYDLYIFPSEEIAKSHVVGRYLSEILERRRAGVTSVSDKSNWIFETYQKDGVLLPRLRWSKCNNLVPNEPAHLTVAFDIFDSTMDAFQISEIEEIKPIEVFGLFPSFVRRFDFSPTPTWYTTIAYTTEGEKHPSHRTFSERLLKIHAAVLASVASNLDKDGSFWPVLKTEITAERADIIKRLHELSDWVITVDRNAGLEFFDAPRDNHEVYDTYVIDCVPERQDLNTVQLVTSTSQIEEVMRLMSKILIEMGLSCSPRNCDFLLSKLKAISGRLAMRLSSRNQYFGELIALALFYSCCEKEDIDVFKGLSPKTGFFLPLDDVQELLLFNKTKVKQRKKSEDEFDDSESQNQTRAVRADLVYVGLSKRGNLYFNFIEIKYRRLLRSTKEVKFLEKIIEQTSNTRERWFEVYFPGQFSSQTSPIQLSG